MIQRAPVDDPRETAWFAVHEALPPFWRVGSVTFDPGRGASSVTARSPHPARGRMPKTVTGNGATEIEALEAMRARLTGAEAPVEDPVRRADLNRRLRQAFYDGAEAAAIAGGRPLTGEELERVLGRYPGDV